MSSRLRTFLLFFFLSAFYMRCASGLERERESFKNGRIHITADESYEPVIEQARAVYEQSYPNAHLLITYKNYAQCLADFYEDSVRLILLPHRPSPVEEALMKQRLAFKPAYGPLVFDAVAIIANKANRDTIFTPQEIANLLIRKNPPYQFVFDGNALSSTLHYVLDSILRDTIVPPHLKGAPNSLALIRYVQHTKNTMGFIGVSWIGDKEDSAQTRFLDSLTVVSVQSKVEGEEGKYVKPYQANIALARYPFLRALHYVLKENYSGLGRGFVNFLSGERGQLIFKRAYLMPAKADFFVRRVRIRE